MIYYIQKTKGKGTRENPKHYKYHTNKGWLYSEKTEKYPVISYKRKGNAEKIARKLQSKTVLWTVTVVNSND